MVVPAEATPVPTGAPRVAGAQPPSTTAAMAAAVRSGRLGGVVRLDIRRRR
jgi:hypothetical protein